jgi:hypothetical protein
MQRDLMHGWIQTLGPLHPLERATRAGREAVAADAHWSLI